MDVEEDEFDISLFQWWNSQGVEEVCILVEVHSLGKHEHLFGAIVFVSDTLRTHSDTCQTRQNEYPIYFFIFYIPDTLGTR